MTHNLNTTNKEKTLCMTFHEAFVTLADLIYYQDFTLFLQEHGLADENGIPYLSELGGDVFKAVKATPEELDYSTGGFFFFVTENGMKKLFEIALGKYLLEKPFKIEL